MPPSTGRITPVIYLASWEARNNTAGAMSSGYATRPRAMRFTNGATSLSKFGSPSWAMPAAISVMVKAGAMAFTRMLYLPQSRASERMKPLSACFVAL